MNGFLNRYSYISLFALLLSLCSQQLNAKPLTEQDIPVTRNLLGTPSPTRAQYLELFPQREMTLYGVDVINNLRDEEGTVVIVVNHSLLSALEDEFQQFADDVASEGYDIVLLDVEGGSPEEFKELLINEGGEDLEGAILAGELPLAWFEQYEYFDDEDEPDNNLLREYPIDLFFTDLNGTWEDTSGNDIYDVHSDENWEPEIWLGRLPAWNLSRIDEDTLIAAYLERVHNYRQGDLNLPHRALNFVDDDWIFAAGQWGDNIGLVYGDALTVAHPESTSAVNYSRELQIDEGYELVQIAVHSTADSHIFWIDNHRRRDYFRFRQLRNDVVPNVMFYNLFACSNMNLSGNLCLGALYALRGNYGLGAVGSSKIGSMLYFEDYYRHLADNLNLGEAFKLWFIQHGHEPRHENWARSWFYGMTHFGDPTLKIPLGLRLQECVVRDDEGGDGDEVADAGETVELFIVIVNMAEEAINNIDVRLDTDDPYLELIEEEGFLNEVAAGDFEIIEDFSLRIDNSCPDGYQALLNLQMLPEGDEMWSSRIDLEISSPKLQFTAFSFDEMEGNEDGWVGSGETGDLFLFVQNSGGDDLQEHGRIDLTSLDGFFVTLEGVGSLPGIVPEEYGAAQSIRYRIAGDVIEDKGALVCTEAFQNNIMRGAGIILLPTSSELEFNDDLDEEPVWMNCYAVTLGYNNAWQWKENGGEGSGGIAFSGGDVNDYYPGHADAVFELPLMMLHRGAVLELHHRISAEDDYDGGFVEVDLGRGWELLEPEAGYNGVAVDNGSFEGGECWSGNLNWRDDRFVIYNDGGPVRVRFRFVSDEAIQDTGWFIDEIRLNGTPYYVEGSVSIPDEFGLSAVYPNPFNSSFRTEYRLNAPSYVSIRLYDISGRQVALLVESEKDAGEYILNFEAGDMPAGEYLLRLRTDRRISMAKVVLLK